MPFFFDFANSGPSVFSTDTSATLSNTADGVTFTLSGDGGGGSEGFLFGNAGTPSVTLNITDSGPDDQITLRFQSSTFPPISRIDGTTANPINLEWDFVAGTWSVRFETSGGGISSPTGSQYLITRFEDNGNLTFVGTGITGVIFTSTNEAGFANINLNSLSGADFNCFCAGTRIATPEGEVAVETLQAGDTVLTADGTVSTVKWLGRQDVDVRLGNPRKTNPICILAGALGETLPKRDLWVSQDHAIELDGCLVNASVLVNGSTIYQVAQMPLEGFTYYHVETEAHELLLAEGCPAESYIEREAMDFDNAEERAARVIPEMDLPRISSQRMLPDQIAARIAARVGTTRVLAKAS